MRLLLRGVRVIDPAASLDLPDSDVLIEDGRLRDIGSGVRSNGADVVSGGVLCPAFIDLHAHLREPGGDDAETVESGALAAAAGGFGCVVAMANTTPPIDDVDAVRHAANRNARAPVRVLQAAAVTESLRGERLTDLRGCAAAGAVAFSDDGRNAYDGELLRRALQQADDVDVPVLVHPEDEAMITAEHPGTDAPRCADRPPEVEVSAVATALQTLRAAGRGRLHLQHLSTAASVNLLAEARRQGLAVTAEVTPHHLTMVEGARTPHHRVNPPLRTDADRAALLHAVRDGIIDAIATDHAPHSDAAKGSRFEDAAPGITGLETALPLLLRLAGDGLPLPLLVERLTTGPRRVLPGAVPMPSLRAGRPLTCTLFDPGATWRLTAASNRSRSLNTPLRGEELRGKVLFTLVDGRFAYTDASLRRLEEREVANV